MLVQGMLGLGDNIYQRSFVRRCEPPVYLTTPWPQLYDDLDYVYPVRPACKLRTQNKNINSLPNDIWHVPPLKFTRPQIKIKYTDDGIINGMKRSFGLDPGKFDLPNCEPVIGNYAVVRPVTVRREWVAASRNPRPEYIHYATEWMTRRGLRVFSIADLSNDEEWIVEPKPETAYSFHNGEFSLPQLIQLLAGAMALIGGPGWIVPAGYALRKPTLCVLGGYGAYNNPLTLSVPGMNNVTYAVPNNFCRCKSNVHNCTKEIKLFDAVFTKWWKHSVEWSSLVA